MTTQRGVSEHDSRGPALDRPIEFDRIEIDRLHPKRAAEAGKLLAASHANYPSFRQMFPDAADRQRVLLCLMTAAARDAARHGHALAAQDDQGLLGVALWMPPGSYPLSWDRQARMLPALLRIAWVARSRFLAFARMGAALDKAVPAAQAWYLQALGVHPRAQRRGVGRRLMTPALAWADGAGQACHLHTSDPANIAYYRRYGFEVSQPAIEVFRGGPVYLGMTRPPQGAKGLSGQ